MKTAILLLVCFVSIFSFGQQKTDKLVLELSPLNTSLQPTLSYNIQGKVSCRFNKYLSISAGHNQQLFGHSLSSTQKTSPNPNKKSSLSNVALGITFINTRKKRIDPTDPSDHTTSWNNKQFRLDVGLSYYKFAALRTDYYSYDLDEQGNYKVINSINRLSASLGFSFILNEMSSQNRLKRQHSFSAGAYYGLNYDLQGYVKIAGENPSQRPPKNYAFSRSGYYIHYNFRQQLTDHLFLGADFFLAKMPYVEYRPNPDLFVLRGGEAENRFRSYAGITIGWVFKSKVPAKS